MRPPKSPFACEDVSTIERQRVQPWCEPPEVIKTVAVVSLFIVICGVVPVVALPMEHQRKMAELISKGQSNPELEQRIERLTTELTELKALLANQASAEGALEERAAR